MYIYTVYVIVLDDICIYITYVVTEFVKVHDKQLRYFRKMTRKKFGNVSDNL